MSDCGTMTQPVATKPYTCGYCGRGIVKGEQHHHFTGKWHGDWQDWRMHNECYDHYCRYDYGEGFTFGDGPPPDRLLTAEEREELTAQGGGT